MNPQPISDPTLDSIAAGDPLSVPSKRQLLSSAIAVFGQGAGMLREAKNLGTELVRIGVGRSEVKPARGDTRFKDAAWQDNAVYRRVAQTYLSTCGAIDNLVDGIDDADWRRAEKARFFMGILTSAAAPTNTFVGNPAALKKAFDTNGKSVVRGIGNWLSDVRHNGGMPSMAKPDALKVGEDLAVTPGGVVSWDQVAELIQYTPTTTKVYERPTLIVPPPIGRFYFLDLAPGRSFVEYSVGRGLQTFLLSWRNPTKDQSQWDIDVYGLFRFEGVAPGASMPV